MSDKPTVQGSIAAIRKERKRAEEFRFALTSNKIITFKDPTTMHPDDADKAMQFGSVNGAVTWREAMATMLSAEDLKKVEAEVEADKMDIYEMQEMIQQYQEHYNSFYGTQGE